MAIAEMLAERNPAINLNIEIHSQFAPFRLDILDRRFGRGIPSPPGDGLAWYLEKAWHKPLAGPVAGKPARRRARPGSGEQDDLRQSVRWAKTALGELLESPNHPKSLTSHGKSIQR